MNLPDNVEKLASGFTKLPDERKNEILSHLAQTKGERAQATVAQLVANGGPEAEFITHIFGKDAPGRADAPANKKLNPVNTK
jgi:hypothetical protein